DNVHPTTPRVLHWLTEVLSTVPDDDTRLIDLYANLGGADPLVIACALEGQEYDSQFLLSPEWIIVTVDEPLRAKAGERSLRMLSSSQFAILVDETANEALQS